MNISVLLFFLHTTLATAIVGSIFLKRGGGVAKYFGLGLLLETVGFAFWALAVMMPENLALFVTAGAVLTLISFIFLLRSGIDDVSPTARRIITVVGTLFVGATFIAGRYIFPTPKFISDEGLLIFNLAPFVQLMYVTALVVVIIPVVEKVSSLFRSGYAGFVRFALSIQAVGAIVLITSADNFSLLVAGWAIGLTYLAFWTTLLFGKDIWRS